MAYEPVLTTHVNEPNSYTLDFYLKHAARLRRAAQGADAEAERHHRAGEGIGLRGRGGAGFPTGMKWQFVLKDTPKPKYICCNADESEPGTFKDHVLMERNPHLLIEGCAIALLRHRREGRLHLHPRRVLPRAADSRSARSRRPTRPGYLGKNIFGSGFDCDVYMHRGAGAYEAGEETALIESLEGKRAQPRHQAAVSRRSRASISARPPSTTSRRSATSRSSC